jgi:divalent metal cation (Fe/Co/Zn/Cd) transporter
VRIHDLRTRASGRLRFIQLHLLVPGDWSVQRGHDLTEQVEDALHEAVEDAVPVVHLEPVDDPRSYETWRMAGPC